MYKVAANLTEPNWLKNPKSFRVTFEISAF